MAIKNLIKEGTVRRWAHLAQTAPLVESFIEERSEQFTESEDNDEDDEVVTEDNFDASGRGPHREGAGKNGEQKGIASNQGAEPKSTPDGKLEIPGTGYAGDHKNSSKGPSKGSTDGGTQLQGKGKVTENMGEEFEEEPELDDEVGDDMPPVGGAPTPGDIDIEGLVAAIAQAISTSTGVEVSVAGHAEPDGDELGGAEVPPPMSDEPPMDAAVGGDSELPAEMPMGDDDVGGEEEEDYNLSEVDEAVFGEEASKRGYTKNESHQAVVESIARKVVAKMTKKK